MARLLLVDDAIEVCDVIGASLEEEGHSVVVAHDGVAAQRAIQSEIFDLVILDVLLPGLPGVDLAKAARARGVPVLLISGDPNSIARLDGHSVYPLLCKPFRLAELRSIVGALLGATKVAAGGSHLPTVSQPVQEDRRSIEGD